MVALAPILVCLLAGPATAQESAIEFSTTEGTWMSLDVSPDGRSLVFELLGDIYALPLDGSRARPILAGRPFQSQPRFAPDGTRLVYVSDESGADNLWISSADGKDARALTTVRRALMLQGVTEAQLTTVSYGEERPAMQGSDESAYSKNRRVELVYGR